LKASLTRKLLVTFIILLVAATLFTLFSHGTFLCSDLSLMFQSQSLDPLEQQVLSLVNGSRVCNYDLELERIALKHFEFRSGGSPGAEESAHWIKERFESFGLNASLEQFEFTTWNLTSKPSLIIDDDGNLSTTSDQFTMQTFTPAHLSWPTPTNGVFNDLVILPLPPAADRSEIGLRPINDAEWAVNTTGKVVLVGKETRWSGSWMKRLNEKLNSQTPAALIYTWWYDWMSFTPPLMGSAEGRTYWNLQLPVSFVDYHEGLWIRNRENTFNVSAYISIDAAIGTGTHYNVIGKIDGYKNPEKYVIISSHYDTVMCCGFCDNGAGTAGVMELAQVMASAVQNGTYKPRYTLVFVTFADEEFWLVGSINYVKQHRNEMPNVIAVLNLDCIGSDNFYYTETEPANGIDLDQIVNRAAQDVGISSSIEPPGASDHETFRDPTWAHNLYYDFWGLDANISDATPVKSSTLLISEPLFYSDKWNTGNLGWIHTSYDNSTSTQTLSWVETEDLENQIKVAVLTILRVSPTPGILGDIDYNGTVDILDAILLANAFGSKPEDRNWDANADINNDKIVDIYDAIILANHYEETGP
jgi:hypothetical protein